MTPLSATVSASIRAELLVLFPDIDGEPTTATPAKPPMPGHPCGAGAERCRICAGRRERLRPGHRRQVVTKLKAAAIATRAGCEMLIANGKDPHILYDIAADKKMSAPASGERSRKKTTRD